MIKASHLEKWVIEPVLKHMDMYSLDAVNLLLGTVAHESKGGLYLKQIKGSALGIYQIEQATYDDILTNYLQYRPNLDKEVRDFGIGYTHGAHQLLGNLFYATAIARLIYYRIASPLPNSNNPEALGGYWKKHYNTVKGKGKVSDFVKNYHWYMKS